MVVINGFFCYLHSCAMLIDPIVSSLFGAWCILEPLHERTNLAINNCIYFKSRDNKSTLDIEKRMLFYRLDETQNYQFYSQSNQIVP